MTPSLTALAAFVGWTLVLALVIVSTRSVWFLLGRKKANEFPAGEKHGPELYWRLNRAHLNAIENLPVFATLVLIGHLTGVSAGRFETLAIAVPAARVLQSLAHLSSGSQPAVLVRFSAYLAQVASFVGMTLILLGWM